MKNILDEKPIDSLNGRLKFCTKFVLDQDIINKSILDIGCGFGWFELYAANNGVKKIIGLERSETDIKTARKYISDKKINFKIGSATALPFKNNSFDTVVSWEVVEHIPKNTEYMLFKEAHRVLKDNGVFYLSTPYKSFFSTVLDPAWFLIGHRHYKEDFLISLANANCFKIEGITIRGGWGEVIGTLNMYISKWILRKKPFFNNFFCKLQDKEFKKKGFANIFIKIRAMKSL